MAARKRGNARKSAKKSRSRSQTTKVAAGRGRKTGPAVTARKTTTKKRTSTRRRATDVVTAADRDLLANGIRR